MTNKKQSKRQFRYLLTGSLIIAFMLFLPYAFYLYKVFPEVEIYETRFFTIDAEIYGSVRNLMYYVFAKFIPLTLLLIWFTTCKHWWYYSIAIPIAVYIFQLVSILNDGVGVVDEVEFIYSVPFTITILVALFFIRSKISLFLKATDLKKQADELIDNATLHKGEDAEE
ncbi:MAG: hypothetical protein KUG51_01390 [Urechidicola sp.]|nr:hypothetical protein [Urechidicola sp.]